MGIKPHETTTPQKGFSPGLSLKRCTHLLTIALLAVVMLGANDPEARFNKVGHEMMCVCGCGQVLLECNHVGCPDSARMIGELHTQIDSNTPSSAILNWFAGKYGATVLAAPIRGGFDNVAWIMPFAVFGFGTLGTAFLVQMWSKKRRLAAAGVATVDSNNWEKISPEARALREKIRKETEYQ
ncbi:cytochrome c-type biogenesis protein [Granulicella rosea]|nr:cytochrome c-type biogenesis protein CcmH [Granulicella rosea]